MSLAKENYVCIKNPVIWNSPESFLRPDRHTLWKRVQAAVVPFLAQLVSVIDRDQNLDLLLDSNCGQSVKRLWLDIFGSDKLLEILHPQADHK